MAGFQGWWVNGNTGKGHHVSEHGLDVQANPEQYGLKPDDVKALLKAKKFNAGDTDPEGGRGLLLKAAMRNGWVRVRGYQGKYAIQTYGNLASHLPKVLRFLKNAGVGPRSEIILTDLASRFTQRYEEGMADIVRALKHGKIPDLAPVKKLKDQKDGIATALSDKQQRIIMRQRIGQKAHIKDPAPGDDFLPESKALKKGFKKLLG